MNKLIICTTGTSIATNLLEAEDKKRLFASSKLAWQEEQEDSQKLEQALNQALANYPIDDSEKRRRLSAELNSLDHLGIDQQDKIVLLATDTAAARICNQALKQALKQAYGLKDAQVVVHRIEDLQVFDAQRLRQKGLPNLIRLVLGEYLQDDNLKYQYEIIFNPTGGYKAIVPFLTVLGMLYGKRTVYIFDQSEQLINLPPLPFSFDLQLYYRVKPALKLLDQKTAASEQEYLNAIINYTEEEKDLFLSFTEPLDGQLSLSPLAYSLFQEQEQEYPLIGPKVVTTLKKCKGESLLNLKKMIAYSTDPLWRNQHAKRWRKERSDLVIIKLGRQGERLAGFYQDGRFYIALAFCDHQSYEKALPKFKRSDFKDLKSFKPWQPEEIEWIEQKEPDELAIKLSDLKSAYDQLLEEKQALEQQQQQADQLAQTVQQLEAQIAELEQAQTALEAQKQQAQQDSEQYQAQLKQVQSQLEQKQAELEQLRSELESVKTALAEQEQAAQKQLQQLQEQLQYEQERAEQNEAQLKALQNELDQKEQTWEQWEQEQAKIFNELQADHQECIKKLERSQAQLKEQSHKAKQKEKEFKTIKQELNVLKKDCAVTKNALETAQHKVVQQNDEIHQLKQSLQTTQQKYEEQKKQNSQCQQKLRDRNEFIAELEQRIHDQKADIEQLQAELEQQKGELEQQQEEQKRLQHELEQRQAEIEQFEAKLEEQATLNQQQLNQIQVMEQERNECSLQLESWKKMGLWQFIKQRYFS